MTIVERGDYSVTVMKDSEDKIWSSLREVQMTAEKHGNKIGIYKKDPTVTQKAEDFLYSGRRLILFFKDKVKNDFKEGDRVDLFLYY